MPSDDKVVSHSEIHLFATAAPRRWLSRYFPPATRAELWAGLSFMAASLFGSAWVMKCRYEALALAHDSVNVDGNVVELWKTKARRSWRCHVQYEYSAPEKANAQTFRNETELPEEYFDHLWKGGPIAVKVCR